MKNIEFTQDHYNKMVENEEDYKDFAFNDLKTAIEQGASIVDENGGFADLDTKLEETEMLNVAAFINFRLAKEDLGEYVEEINS